MYLHILSMQLTVYKLEHDYTEDINASIFSASWIQICPYNQIERHKEVKNHTNEEPLPLSCCKGFWFCVILHKIYYWQLTFLNSK